MTPEYDYNAASLYKTKLFRDIRDSIVIELGIPSDEVRDIIGPIVAQHVEQATKRQQVIDIANRMLGEQTALEIPNLVAKDGVVTVARAKKKRKAKTVPQATREDASFLLELLRRAKQEHSLSLSAMAIALGVSSHTVHGWLYKEDSVPYSRNRSTIARYLRQFAYDIPARIKSLSFQSFFQHVKVSTVSLAVLVVGYGCKASAAERGLSCQPSLMSVSLMTATKQSSSLTKSK